MNFAHYDVFGGEAVNFIRLRLTNHRNLERAAKEVLGGFLYFYHHVSLGSVTLVNFSPLLSFIDTDDKRGDSGAEER